MDLINDASFIIISGPPQKGKRDRISQVRSHITKRYFQRLHQKLKIDGDLSKHAKSTSLARRGNTHQRSLAVKLSPELSHTILPLDHPMRDESFFKTETERKMQRFFNMHMQIMGNPIVHQEPFFQSIASWTITDPHFTSAKLLIASVFDEVRELGKLSPWAFRQRSISIRLLNNALHSDYPVNTDALIGSIHCLLGFEILNGDRENYSRLRRIATSILEQGVRWHEDVWTGLAKGFFLLDQTHRIQIAPDKISYPLVPDLSDDYKFSFPVDYSIFSLGERRPHEKNALICSLGVELYTLLSIAESSENLIPQSTYNFVTLLHRRSLPQPNLRDIPANSQDPLDDNEWSRAIRETIFILSSYLLSGTQDQNASFPTCRLYSRLSKLDIGSVVFPGILLWCCAIGARFADKNNKAWFLNKLMGVCYPWILGKWEETCESICLVSNTLEKVRPLRIERDVALLCGSRKIEVDESGSTP